MSRTYTVQITVSDSLIADGLDMWNAVEIRGAIIAGMLPNASQGEKMGVMVKTVSVTCLLCNATGETEDFCTRHRIDYLAWLREQDLTTDTPAHVRQYVEAHR